MAATGYWSDRLFYRVMFNRINPARELKSNTAAVGVGYWFGPNRRPKGSHPNQGAPEPQYVTDPQLTIFGGQSVVNTFLSESAKAGAVEYRQGILPHLDATASYIYEGNPQIVRRSGVALQVWPVNTFFGETTAVGLGVGPYIFIDRKHPVSAGARNPAAIAPLVSLTVARQLSEHWVVRLVWDRVTSTYNRDSDIFLLGVGYRWR